MLRTACSETGKGQRATWMRGERSAADEREVGRRRKQTLFSSYTSPASSPSLPTQGTVRYLIGANVGSVQHCQELNTAQRSSRGTHSVSDQQMPSSASSFRQPGPPAGSAWTPRAASPRLSPRDVVRAAHQTLQQNQTRALASRKGRPPPSSIRATTRSELSADARSFLARAYGDMPRLDGFGAKVTEADGANGEMADVMTMFPGGSIPPRLRPTPEEIEVAHVAQIVRESSAAPVEEEDPRVARRREEEAEKKSMAILSGLLIQTGEAMAKAEEAMAEEITEKQEALARELQEREEAASGGLAKPGTRPDRRRKRKKKGGSTPDVGGSTTAASARGHSSSSSSDEEEEIKAAASSGDEDTGDEGRDADEKLAMVPTVTQGFDDLYPCRRNEMKDDMRSRQPGRTAGGEHGAPGIGRPSKSDRMRRIVRAQDKEAAGTRGGDKDPDDWPTLTEDDMIAMLKRTRFFVNAELNESVLARVADWFEVQHYEPFSQIVEEGTWCHSFTILYEGTLEARGRVYRHPTFKKKRKVKEPTDPLAALLVEGPTEKELAEQEKKRKEEDEAVQAKMAAATLLQAPRLVGTYETLAPVLLYAGATMGEAGLAAAAVPLSQASLPGMAGARFPHLCSVRSLTRCTLLVLRRSKSLLELQSLPFTAREGWLEEARKAQRAALGCTVRWLHHAIRRLRLLEPLRPSLVRGLERLCEYRVVPSGTTLCRLAEPATHLFVVLAGEVGVYQQNAQQTHGDSRHNRHDDGHGDDVTSPTLSLLRRVSGSSDVPLLGEGPLLRATALEALEATRTLPSPTHSMTHTEVQMVVIPYAQLVQRHVLFSELRGRTVAVRSAPSRLISVLDPSGNFTRMTVAASERPDEHIPSAPKTPPPQTPPPPPTLLAALTDRNRPTGAILQGFSRPSSLAGSRLNSPKRSSSRVQSPNFARGTSSRGAPRELAKQGQGPS